MRRASPSCRRATCPATSCRRAAPASPREPAAQPGSDGRASGGSRWTRRAASPLTYRVPAGTGRGHRSLVVRAGRRRIGLRVAIRARMRIRRSLSVAPGSRRVDLGPYTGTAGARRTIRGRGWPAGVRVTARRGRTVVARARTSRRGRFAMTSRRFTRPGRHWVVVKAGRRRLAVPLAVRPPAAPPAPSPPHPTRGRVAGRPAHRRGGGHRVRARGRRDRRHLSPGPRVRPPRRRGVQPPSCRSATSSMSRATSRRSSPPTNRRGGA